MSTRRLLAFVAVVFSAPQLAPAAPKIIVKKLEAMCDGTSAKLIVTLDSLTYSYYGNGLYYHFDPPSPGDLSGKTSNPFDLTLPGFPPGSSHILWVSTSKDSTGGSSSTNYNFEMPSCGPVPKGLTWSLIPSKSPSGTIQVGCANQCNAFQGDTPCTQALPLLCIKKAGPGLPFPPPSSFDNSNQYNRWSGGLVGTTGPLVPPKSLAAADALCAQEFGPGWRVAEFHDGWGWAFQAYGGVGDTSQRFWIHINDQPKAICWK